VGKGEGGRIRSNSGKMAWNPQRKHFDRTPIGDSSFLKERGKRGVLCWGVWRAVIPCLGLWYSEDSEKQNTSKRNMLLLRVVGCQTLKPGFASAENWESRKKRKSEQKYGRFLRW